MFPASAMEEIFEPNHFPALLYSAKQEYGQKRHNRPMHRHTSLCELLLCYQGFGTYYVGDTSYPLQKGDVVFGNVGELHEVTSDYDTEIGTYCFGIGNLHFKGLPLNYLIPEGSAHVRASGGQFRLFEMLCAQIDSLYADGAHDRLTAQLLLGALVIQATRLPEETIRRTPPGESQLPARIKAYLDAHYTEPLQLDELADKMGCSTPYLSHVFKGAFGYAPIQYVIRRRIGLAQTWLISSDLSATQIAAMVGYDDPSYFSVLFTKVVGLSPIRYRKQYLETLKGGRSQR